MEDYHRLTARVNSGSLIHVLNNAYSVHSRLIGCKVEVRLYAEHLEVWLRQRKLDTLPRLLGRGKHRIDYRHIIDWLVRKPGAFADYRYREELFPTSRFRMVYDALRQTTPGRAEKEYLAILQLAAMEGQQATDDAIRLLLSEDKAVSSEHVQGIVQAGRELPPPTQIEVAAPDLAAYDALLSQTEVA